MKIINTLIRFWIQKLLTNRTYFYQIILQFVKERSCYILFKRISQYSISLITFIILINFMITSSRFLSAEEHILSRNLDLFRYSVYFNFKTFSIPSSSMVPNLNVGDPILVNTSFRYTIQSMQSRRYPRNNIPFLYLPKAQDRIRFAFD